MIISPNQKSICERVINAFETGSADGDYSNISIYHDGPNRIRQITYGRAQTTEYSHLRELVEMYINANGMYAASMREYLPLIEHTPLVDNTEFKNLLRKAGSEDSIMRETQDQLFDAKYYQPALKWAGDNGFTLALSLLVIYDSFIHSGGILKLIRSRFPEIPPAQGGDEKVWITQYVDARQNWLANHSNPELHATVYRTKCFQREINRSNWDLALTPINANGVMVSAKAATSLTQIDFATINQNLANGEIPFLGDPHLTGEAGSIVSALAATSIATDSQGFEAQSATISEGEWNFFGRQNYNLSGTVTHVGHKEGEDGYYQRVGLYWSQGVGRDDLDGRDHDWPWSAAFISWVMGKAGAGTRFHNAAQHSQYISKAIRDRIQGNDKAGYWGYRLNEMKPKIGDIVCWGREIGVDYDHQHQGDYSGHCDIVVAVNSNQIEVIGGNVGNSVTRRPLALDTQGYLQSTVQGGENLFALMSCRISSSNA